MGKEFVLSFWYMNPGDVTEHMQPAIYITTLSNTPVFVDISTPRIAKTSKPYVKVGPQLKYTVSNLSH